MTLTAEYAPADPPGSAISPELREKIEKPYCFQASERGSAAPSLLDRDLERWNHVDSNRALANRYERAAASFAALLALIAIDQGVTV